MQNKTSLCFRADFSDFKGFMKVPHTTYIFSASALEKHNKQHTSFNFLLVVGYES